MSRRSYSSRTQRRGFMLIEMLAALILLTAFALVASRLFSWSMRVIRDAPEAEQQILAFDSMVNALRRDVWAAGTIARDDDGTLVLHSANATDVRWRLDGDTVTRTSEGAEGQSAVWPGLSGRLRAETDGPMVVLHLLDRDGKIGDTIALPSAVQLMERGLP